MDGSELQAVEVIEINGIGRRGNMDSFDSAGDFNNDGFDDIIQGGFGNAFTGTCREFGGDDVGKVAINLGHADGQPSPGTVFLAPCGDTLFQDVRGIGDVNGDGFDDVSIYRAGHPDYAIFYGRSAIPVGPLWDELDAEYFIFGQLPAFQSPHGDFDNDNVADYLVSNHLGREDSLLHSFPPSRPLITLNGDNPVVIEIGPPLLGCRCHCF